MANLSGRRWPTKLSPADPSLPRGDKYYNKISYSATIIIGSTFGGYTLPLHQQVKIKATIENQKTKIQFLDYTKGVIRKWGLEKEMTKGVKIGANPKAGMGNI